MKEVKKSLYGTLCIAYLAAALPIIKSKTPDNDLFFLITTGREILKNGIPYLNPFHINQGLEIIVQQWLGCIFNYYIYTALGNAGLFIITVIYTMLHLWALLSVVRLFTKSRKTTILILLMDFIVMYPFFCLRGSLLTSTILLGEVYILIQYARNKKKRYLTILPILSLFLINWQMASWPIFILITFTFLFPGRMGETSTYYKENKKTIGKLLTAICFSMAAGFINPYGLKGMMYLLNSITVLKDYVHEFSKVEAVSTSALISYIHLCMVILYCFRKQKKTDLRYIALSLFAIILSISIQRNIWYSILAIPTSAIMLDQIGKQEIIQELVALFLPAKRLGYSILELGTWLFIIILSTTAYILPYSPASTEYNNDYVPYSAVSYLSKLKNSEDIRLMTEFNNGGYFMWHGFKIYMEPRPELYMKSINKKENIYTEYIKTRSDALQLSVVLSKYKFTHVIAQKNTPVYFFMLERDDYQPVLSTKLDYQLFEKINNERDIKEEKNIQTAPRNNSNTDNHIILPDEFV